MPKPPDAEVAQATVRKRGPLGAMARRIRAMLAAGELEAELHRKTAEIEALRTRAEEAEHVVRLTEGLTGVGFWRFDPQRNERFWSPSIFTIFGLDPANGPPPAGGIGMFDPVDQASLRDQVGGRAGGSADREYGITRGDGERAYIRMSGARERGADGGVSHMYGAIVDVTEARTRELALAESEARYRLLADSVQDVIIRFDTEGVIEFVSPSARLFGYAPADVVGQPIWAFGDDTLAQTTRENLARYRSGAPFPNGQRFETEIRRADGTAVWVESVETGIYDASGTFCGIVAVLRDVTERLRLEAELRRKQAEAEAAVVAKSEFLANMSHEIRTPLTAVIGYAGLIAKMADLPEKGRAYADRVARSGEALNAVVNNILDFSKVEAGQLVLRPGPCAIQDLVADATGPVREMADQKGLHLGVELRSPLPETVLVDRARLNQVMLNLLSNAIKFTSAGSVTISLGHDRETDRLSVSVTDTGIGIPAAQADRLFQRFSQVEGANARRFAGVGLGLAISKGLVELMDGRIGFRSAEGMGSTFTFDIAAPEVASLPTGGTGASDAAPGLPPLKILVVDDVAVNRDLLAALLGPFSPEITEAADGREAVAAAARRRFDLVLMDVQMPGMDGLAATRAIRETSPLNAGTPVIAVSASVLPTDVEACRAAGMNDHVPKPISPRDLLTKIAAWTDPDARPQAEFAA